MCYFWNSYYPAWQAFVGELKGVIKARQFRVRPPRSCTPLFTLPSTFKVWARRKYTGYPVSLWKYEPAKFLPHHTNITLRLRNPLSAGISFPWSSTQFKECEIENVILLRSSQRWTLVSYTEYLVNKYIESWVSLIFYFIQHHPIMTEY